MKVLKECKTIVAVGIFDNKVNVRKLREIDIRKACTFGGRCIKYIPRFTEFDVFKPFTQDCDINNFNNLTLYIVEVYEGNIFFIKKYNLVYGKFLKQLLKNGIKLKIL